MQTLGLSDSTPRSESRLRSLFWPSVQSAADVDYLGAQGYWICTLVGAVTCVFLAATGHAIVGILVLLFYYLGGVGVRENSAYAAAMVLAVYALDSMASPPSVGRILIGVLLLSNLRATWIASHWNPASEEASPQPRLGDTWSDKFADRFPSWLWPKVRIFYYIFSACTLALFGVGLILLISRHPR
jgi:hypothetical protein